MTQLDGARNDSPLRHYLAILWRRKGLVFVALTVTIVAAAYYSFQQPTIYESAAEVHLRPPLLSAAGDSPQGVNLQDEAALARSVPVAEHAGRLLGEPAPATGLLTGLSVTTAQPGTSVLRFRYTARDPAVSQRLAQVFATAYLEYRRDELLAELDNASKPLREQAQTVRKRLSELNQRLLATADTAQRQSLQTETGALTSQLLSLEQQIHQLLPPANLQFGSIIRPATLPVAPSGPNHASDFTLALLVGAALATGLAILIDRLDGRVRGREELEAALGAPVLAAVPTLSHGRNGSSPLVTLTAPQSAAAEAYRSLRNTILLAKSEEPIRTLIVTSVDANQATTVTSANLAIVLAMAGLKTVIVAAEATGSRRLHRLFEDCPELDGAVQVLELADLLSGAGRAERVARRLMMSTRGDEPGSTGDWGHFLGLVGALPVGQAQDLQAPTPGGHAPTPGGHAPTPGRHGSYLGDLLASEVLPKVLAGLRERAEFVILDAPPLTSGADATILASAADGVLLVARAGRTGRETLGHAERELSRVGAKLIGTVLHQ